MDIQGVRPKRGEVWWVNFNPARGTEVQKNRPAVVVSTDASNKYLSRLQVVPLTSNTSRVYTSECLLTVLSQESKAMADQIRTVSLARFGKKIETLEKRHMSKIEHIIKIQLGLE